MPGNLKQLCPIYARNCHMYIGIVALYLIDRIDSSSKIVEHWAKRDDLGLLQQLGVIPKQGI
jgi:hypothetical protein